MGTEDNNLADCMGMEDIGKRHGTNKVVVRNSATVGFGYWVGVPVRIDRLLVTYLQLAYMAVHFRLQGLGALLLKLEIEACLIQAAG